MRKSKYPETQIVQILKEQEVGAKVEEITRKYGISSATFFKWKNRYGGMEIIGSQTDEGAGGGEFEAQAFVYGTGA